MTAEAAPPRPDPWATTAPREAMRDLDEGRIVSLAPSVNLTPVGGEMVPVPYNVMDFGGHDDAYTPSVRFTGRRAMVLRSFSQHVHGDEAGTGGGVASGTCGGICEPIGHAAQVRAEGSPVIRHLDQSWMNNRNTVGEAQFVRDTGVYQPPPDTDPIPGSARAAPDGSQVMSDAGPDPSLSRPGAQLAFLDPQGRFSPAPPTTAPPAPAPPQTAPAPTARSAPPAPRATGYGLWTRLMTALGLAEAGHEMGDMAGREYVGPEGVRGKQLSDALTDGAPSPFSPQGQQIGGALGDGGMGPIDGTNTMLSLKAGRPMDFRTAPPGEVDDLVRQPWPSAEQLARNRQALKQARERPSKPAEAPAPVPGDSGGGGGNARIAEDERRRRCEVGPYKLMKDACGPGTQAHHIIPDYTLRFGNRGEAERNQKRIPGNTENPQKPGTYPTFNQGMCICLQGNAKIPADSDLAPDDPEREHQAAHSGDLLIAVDGRSGTPVGTVTLKQVIDRSEDALGRVRGECAPEIGAAIDAEFAGVDRNQLARSTQGLPQGEALKALRAGKLQGYKPD